MAETATDLTAKIDAAVDRYIELLTSGDTEAIADLYAEGATVEDPIGAPVRSTRAELIEFYGLVCNLDEHTATLKWKKIAGDTAVFGFTSSPRLVTPDSRSRQSTSWSSTPTAR